MNREVKAEDIDFLKTLIIKLDITIEAERNNVSADGLMLIFDFIEKNRKESITKALDILNRTQNKWQKLKEWLDRVFQIYLNESDHKMMSIYGTILDKMRELEGEDE